MTNRKMQQQNGNNITKFTTSTLRNIYIQTYIQISTKDEYYKTIRKIKEHVNKFLLFKKLKQKKERKKKKTPKELLHYGQMHIVQTHRERNL